MVHHRPFAEGLLRTHVAERPQQVARHGQAGARLAMGQPEIGDPQVGVQINQQIGRLDVAMHHAHLVGVFQGEGGLHAQPGHGAEIGPARERLRR